MKKIIPVILISLLLITMVTALFGFNKETVINYKIKEIVLVRDNFRLKKDVVECTGVIDNKDFIPCPPMEEQYDFDWVEKIIYSKERESIILDGDKYNNANYFGNEVVQWSYPIGDRNFIEFGDCTVTEKRKGLCDKSRLLN